MTRAPQPMHQETVFVRLANMFRTPVKIFESCERNWFGKKIQNKNYCLYQSNLDPGAFLASKFVTAQSHKFTKREGSAGIEVLQV